MKTLSRAMLFLSTLSLLGIGACGQSDESDEDKVRNVAKLVADRSPARCNYMTEQFIKQAYPSPSRRSCRRTTDDTKPGIVEKIAVDDAKAQATVNFQGFRSRLKLEKENGAWKIHSFDYTVDPNSERAGPAPRASQPSPKPKIEEGLSAIGTVEAYYESIKDGDGAAFCGLISRRHAMRLLSEKSNTPIMDCVEGLQGYEWSKTRKLARGVKTLDVERSRAGAIVSLTGGKRVMLEREHGRWVVDGVEKQTNG